MSILLTHPSMEPEGGLFPTNSGNGALRHGRFLSGLLRAAELRGGMPFLYGFAAGEREPTACTTISTLSLTRNRKVLGFFRPHCT
jgi:hypothetical protein